MPTQRLSLFAALPSRNLESFASAVQNLSSAGLSQFKTLTHVYKDDTTSHGRRPSDFIRLHLDQLSSTDQGNLTGTQKSYERPRAVLEVTDTPEMNKRPVTSRITHTVPCTSGDPQKLVQSMGYSLAFSFFEQGYQIVIGTILLRIFQVFKAVEGTTTPSAAAAAAAAEEEEEVMVVDGHESNNISKAVRELTGEAIGDGTTWIVQSDVDIKAGSPEDLKRGTEDLLRLRRDLQGYIDLSTLLDELR